jgi:hypothetical protein
MKNVEARIHSHFNSFKLLNHSFQCCQNNCSFSRDKAQGPTQPCPFILSRTSHTFRIGHVVLSAFKDEEEIVLKSKRDWRTSGPLCISQDSAHTEGLKIHLNLALGKKEKFRDGPFTRQCQTTTIPEWSLSISCVFSLSHWYLQERWFLQTADLNPTTCKGQHRLLWKPGTRLQGSNHNPEPHPPLHQPASCIHSALTSSILLLSPQEHSPRLEKGGLEGKDGLSISIYQMYK